MYSGLEIANLCQTLPQSMANLIAENPVMFVKCPLMFVPASLSLGEYFETV